MRLHISLLSLALLLSSCVSNQLLNANPEVKVIPAAEVRFAWNIERFPHKQKVGDIKLAYPRQEWSQIEAQLIDFAHQHHGNLIHIHKFIEQGEYLEGVLYQVAPEVLGASADTSTAKRLVLFRDELSPLNKNSPTKIGFYGTEVDLKDELIMNYRIPAKIDSIPFHIQGEKSLLPLNENENFFWLSRKMEGRQYGNAIRLQYGGLQILNLPANKARAWLSSIQYQKSQAL